MRAKHELFCNFDLCKSDWTQHGKIYKKVHVLLSNPFSLVKNFVHHILNFGFIIHKLARSILDFVSITNDPAFRNLGLVYIDFFCRRPLMKCFSTMYFFLVWLLRCSPLISPLICATIALSAFLVLCSSSHLEHWDKENKTREALSVIWEQISEKL